MAGNFLEQLKKAPILCDGATGTLLYAKGVFINRCYDELNLSQPELIRQLHHDYLHAGAQIIETNTFGGNRFRLERHGLANKVREINLAGVKLAREEAKNFDVWVGASVGPLGVRIEPLGKISLQEARDAFREQIAALNEAGVDLILLETFGYLEEIHQALLAANEVNPNLPVVAQVTIDEDGNCLDGSAPEIFVPRIGGVGRGRHWLQLQRRPGGHAGCHGARSGPDFPAGGCTAERRNSPVGGRTKHLSVLAGVHGELCAEVCGGGSEPGRRMLRNDSGTYQGDEVGSACGRGAGQDGGRWS